MEMQAYVLRIGVEGIQRYIQSSGKLKEMIGGSEVINYITSQDFYGELLPGMKAVAPRDMGPTWMPTAKDYIVAQAAAGALWLIVFDEGVAKGFLMRASERLLRDFPGLPFYSGLASFPWADTDEGRKGYAGARKEVEEQIKAQRNAAPVPMGAPLLPILRVARLDGLPAVAGEDEERLSLVSVGRRSQKMLDRSAERLRKLAPKMSDVKLIWENDLTNMLGGGTGAPGTRQDKVALICMDGNDLGKKFGQCLKEAEGKSLGESLVALRRLSELVEHCNTEAFRAACQLVISHEVESHERKQGALPRKLIMPLRPLVMGGDDITIIVRADLALPFLEIFTREFERASGGEHLTLGIGMVVMAASFPFAKAFPLAEALQDSAKKLTKHLEPGERPSSVDYLVLTEEVEGDLQAVRERLFSSPGTERLTSKPLEMKTRALEGLLIHGNTALTCLPRGQLREAWTVCREGSQATSPLWQKLYENAARGLGGRHGKLLTAKGFKEIFPENFFQLNEQGVKYTAVGDYLELEQLLPADEEDRNRLLEAMQLVGTAKAGEEGTHV